MDVNVITTKSILTDIKVQVDEDILANMELELYCGTVAQILVESETANLN